MCIPFSTISILENISLDFIHFSERRKIGSTCSRRKSREDAPFLDDNNECSRIMFSLF